MPRRHRHVGSTPSFEAPLTAISSSLGRLRADIGVLLDTATRSPSGSRRAALVDVNHQLRLLGQRVNVALGTSPPAEGSQQQRS